MINLKNKKNFLNIEINSVFKQVLFLMENTNKSLFITGRAGTGKSTLLEYFRSITKKKLAVIAPTGVAALNVSGQTIHSFFGFSYDVTIKTIEAPTSQKLKIYKNLDILIIDEISMVRADLLDCIETFLRKYGPKIGQPFGGVQMIFIGDLYQLPPVVKTSDRKALLNIYKTPYFFSASIFSKKHLFKEIDFVFEIIELTKIYRQNDEEFISILNHIRNNQIKSDHLKILNQRVIPDFLKKDVTDFITLVPTNEKAFNLNRKELDKITGLLFDYEGSKTGKFTEDNLPTEEKLELKVGAQIMFLNNDSLGRWVNGSLGKIIEIEMGEEEADKIIIELFTGEKVEVLPYTWQMIEYKFNDKKECLETKKIGSFTQYPIKLAWAITIHKSQGKTFPKMVLDLDKGTFAPGQLYVALSRAVSLEGIVLIKPIEKKHIFCDFQVVKFLTEFQYKKAGGLLSQEERISLIKEAIKNKQKLEIVYLKSSDEKTERIICPKKIGERFFHGKKFLGLTAFCEKRKEERVFSVDKILEIKKINK